MSISTTNPYLNNPRLSALEQEVLWEYAKLGDKTKRIAMLAKDTAEDPNEPLLAELRVLEKKLGLVLTLFKSSVYGVLMDRKERLAMEEQSRMDQARLEAEAQHHAQDRDQAYDDYSRDSYDGYQ